MTDGSNPGVTRRRPTYEDDVSLVDIYLTLKRNRSLFLTVVVATFFCSILLAYLNYSSQSAAENSSAPKVEYSLWLEIGYISKANFARIGLLDDPDNAVEKLKNIYITKTIDEFSTSGNEEFNLSSVSVVRPNNSELIGLEIIGDEENNKSYEKALNTIANYLIDDHNSKFDVNNTTLKLQPTRIVQQFKKKIQPEKNKNRTMNLLILTPVLGIIFGVFFGFLAIFVKSFLTKVKEVEETD